MKRSLLAPVILSALLPIAAFAQSGTEISAGNPGNLHRAAPAATAKPKNIQQGPYNMGEAIFNGTYKFKKGSSTHAAEKTHRLTILRTGLTGADAQKMNPDMLGKEMSDREANALEYYINMKFGKYVTSAPSWAKTEPPIKVENK